MTKTHETSDVDPGRPPVGVFSLGGTIAMTSAHGAAGVTPSLSSADLLAAVPGLASTGIPLTTHDVRQLPGASLKFNDIADLYRTIRQQFDANAITSAVVTQGTDTIEETSWLLDLLHDGPQPIVVTGAMRHPAMAGADGPANLLSAVTAAASPLARGLGVTVMFADELHLAATVRKTHSTSITAFTSPQNGPVGHLTEGRLHVWGRRSPSRFVGGVPLADLDAPKILVLPMTLGLNADLMESLGSRLDGAVVAGFGVGHVPADLVPSLADLAKRVPVVLTSRTGAGSTATNTYAFAGSEADLLASGLISGGYLDPFKARILLQVLVATGVTTEGIARLFDVRHPAAGDAPAQLGGPRCEQLK